MKTPISKDELLKWLGAPEKDIPPHILEILNEFGVELLNDEFNAWDFYFEMFEKRIFERFPNEGIRFIKDYFEDFPKDLESIKKDISTTRKREKLEGHKRVLSQFQPMPSNEIIELELKRHRPYLQDYIDSVNSELKALPTQQGKEQTPELKIDQIALKYAYEGLQITRGNGNKIAKQYGHNSGEKLFQRFTFYSSAANRKGKPDLCTPKKLDNKIKLIESIIEILPTTKQERAKDEVSILKKIYEAEYQ